MKLDDMYDKIGRKCQKQLTFSSNQYKLKSSGIEKELEKSFKGTEKPGKFFLNPLLIKLLRSLVWLM